MSFRFGEKSDTIESRAYTLYKTIDSSFSYDVKLDTSDTSSTSSTCSESMSDDSTHCVKSSSRSKYFTQQRIKFYKEKKSRNLSVIEYLEYTSSTISKFNKNSPFIRMLMYRRIKVNDSGCSSHIAAFVPDLTVENKRSCWAFGKFAIGENSERNRYGNNRLSTHAEMDALKKLDNLFRVTRCKKQSMDLVVLRVNKSGNLCESAPCYHCTHELNIFQKKKGISINKLYFSRWDGSIICIKFSDWVSNGETSISTGWRWLSRGDCK